jgi:hypothetical protein
MDGGDQEADAQGHTQRTEPPEPADVPGQQQASGYHHLDHAHDPQRHPRRGDLPGPLPAHRGRRHDSGQQHGGCRLVGHGLLKAVLPGHLMGSLAPPATDVAPSQMELDHGRGQTHRLTVEGCRDAPPDVTAPLSHT